MIRGRRMLTMALIAAGALACCGSASASEPWWHVSTLSSPPSPATSNAMVTVDVANVGDAATPGTVEGNLAAALAGETEHLVTVVDRLPAGVEPVEAHVRGGGTDFAKKEETAETALGHNLCTISGGATFSVTCVYVNPVRAYEQVLVALEVKVQPGAGGGVNEVSVSGGGTPPLVSRHALALEGPVSFGAQSYEQAAEEEGGSFTRQAGKHPFQFTTTLMLNTQAARGLVDENNKERVHQEVVPVALAKDLRFNLPPGFAGNPQPLPKCSQHVFLEQFSGHNLCPNDSAIGVAAPMITSFTNAFAPDPVVSPVYNLEPSVGEPAKFGFFTVVGPAVVDTSVRTGGDYAVVATVSNIPSSAPFIGSVVTLWGVPADARHDNSRNLQCLEDLSAQEVKGPVAGPEPSCSPEGAEQPFLIMPTSCEGPLRTSVEGDSWGAIGRFTTPFSYAYQNSLGEEYGQVGCNRLSFEPSISVTPDGREASTPTGLSVDVHVAQDASLNPRGLAESTVRGITVALPAGVGLNPSGADGLSACGLEEVGLESSFEQSCPESSKVGTVEIRTPLLAQPLVGAAYLARQAANPFGSLLALYIVAKDPVSGVIVKVAGEVKPNPLTGQLVSTISNSPPLPFEDATIHFFGGSRAPLGTPALCGPYTTTSSLAPWSGQDAVESSSTFSITSGPNRTPCSDPLPFSPSLTAGSVNLQAGAFTPFTMTMSREDGNQSLDAVRLQMPPGLSGLLTGVKLCGEAEANAGTCGPESLIGETTVSVGLGGNPYSVKGGRVYITGPYEGAPFGLSIVNPAKAGPFDLERTPTHSPACDCVVVRAKIEVDPTTAALTVTSDTTGPFRIPTMLEGIPLQIKHVNVTIDRPGFTFNPTNCEPMGIGGGLTSDQEAVDTLHVPFQVTNCATLVFKPQFKVTTSGHTSRKSGASLRVKLSYPKAPWGSQANVRSVKVQLPKQLPSRLSTLQKACTDRTFAANPAACPPSSRVGMAKASTPLIPVELSGPAYFVSHGGAKFPELIIVLSGYGVTIDLHGETFINKAGITSSTFHTVPDAPVGTFELELPEGPNSALAANKDLCTSELHMPTDFTAQNGLQVKQDTDITVAGCPRRRTAKGSRHGREAPHKRS